MDSNRIYVGGLGAEVDEGALKKLISKHGSISKFELKNKKDLDGNILATFAYINIDSPHHKVETCIQKLDGSIWNDQTLKVQRARESFVERLKRERQEAAEGKTTNVENFDSKKFNWQKQDEYDGHNRYSNYKKEYIEHDQKRGKYSAEPPRKKLREESYDELRDEKVVEHSEVANQLYIGGLGARVNEDTLKKMVSRFITLTEFNLTRVNNQDERAVTSFVYMKTDSSKFKTETCINQLNGNIWNGYTLIVERTSKTYKKILKEEREYAKEMEAEEFDDSNESEKLYGSPPKEFKEEEEEEEKPNKSVVSFNSSDAGQFSMLSLLKEAESKYDSEDDRKDIKEEKGDFLTSNLASVRNFFIQPADPRLEKAIQWMTQKFDENMKADLEETKKIVHCVLVDKKKPSFSVK